MANYRVSTNTNNSDVTTKDKTKETTKTRKMNQFRFSALEQGFLKISVRLQTAFSAETRLAGGQWLEAHVNMVTLRMFRIGTRMPTVSRTEGQHLAPLNTFIKKRSSK
jgi:hypothetical protein